MRIIFIVLFSLLTSSSLVAGPNSDHFKVDYTVTFEPSLKSALVQLRVEDGALVPRLNFRIKPKQYSDFRSQGEFSIEGNRAIWLPTKGPATLSYRVRIDHQRKDRGYDARITNNWVIVRGDDLVPSVKARMRKGMKSESRLSFVLPDQWSSIETGWKRIGANQFSIDNPTTRFDRPSGWIIAGKISTRRDEIGKTQIAVSGPLGEELRRMDILSFLNLIWPQTQKAWGTSPEKILFVSAGNPMWRGGLSGPNSLFLHAERPLVSENGTSTLIHELTHVLTRIRGEKNDDWIAEGIAEFYAIELLHRAGGSSPERYQQTYAWLEEYSAQVAHLRSKHSRGPTTARAVLFIAEIDRELRRRSAGKRSFDQVVQALIKLRKVSKEQFCQTVEQVAGGKLKMLESPLIQ
jgi:predicted metalloprotease with PDZ domain